MSKPGDRAVNELLEVIKSVITSRYVEDPEPLCSPFYVIASGDEPSFAFASLNRRDRLELLADMVSWRDYGRKGITAAQQRVIIANVLDGKPPETCWKALLTGMFSRKRFETFSEMVRRTLWWGRRRDETWMGLIVLWPTCAATSMTTASAKIGKTCRRKERSATSRPSRRSTTRHSSALPARPGMCLATGARRI